MKWLHTFVYTTTLPPEPGCYKHFYEKIGNHLMLITCVFIACGSNELR